MTTASQQVLILALKDDLEAQGKLMTKAINARARNDIRECAEVKAKLDTLTKHIQAQSALLKMSGCSEQYIRSFLYQ